MPQLPTGVTVAAGVDETSALVMVIAAAVAAVIVLAVSPRVAIPVVVLELLLGILIGPQGLDIARIDPTTSLLGDLGLGMLFFFAGYEIDFDRIKGRPLELADRSAGASRSPWPTGSAARSPPPGSSSPSSTRDRRWRRPPSGP